MRWYGIFLGPYKKPWKNLKKRLKDVKLKKVFAADAGAVLAKNVNVKPDFVIGDLDSLTEEEISDIKEMEVQIIKWPRDKDYTDFELILKKISDPEGKRYLIVGGIGGRLDHTIENIALARGLKAEVFFLFPGGEAHILHPGMSIEYISNGEEIISLISLSNSVKIGASKGLKWGVENKELKKGESRGIHNTPDNKEVKIKVKTGELLVVIYYQEMF